MNAIFDDFDDIAALAEGLDDAAPGARIMAVMDLADTADPAAIPHLARAIGDADASVRKQAALALTDFDGPETAAALIPALIDPEADVREAAAVSLTELKDPAAGDAILPHLDAADDFKLLGVPYTHRTLPTNREVYISGGEVSVKKQRRTINRIARKITH